MATLLPKCVFLFYYDVVRVCGFINFIFRLFSSKRDYENIVVTKTPTFSGIYLQQKRTGFRYWTSGNKATTDTEMK